MKILVTGCGRSGTGYAAKALQALGLDVGHEHERKNGTSDWRAVAWPLEKVVQYDLVLHQVRHPLKVIASWNTVADSAWALLRERMPHFFAWDASPLVKTMHYWVTWNLLAYSLCQKTYQVEEFEMVWRGLQVDKDLPRLDWDAFKRVSTEYNTRKTSPAHLGDLSWERLIAEDARMAERVIILARKWGYGPEG